MKKFLKDLVSGKRVLILGFGREGRSTYRLLTEAGCYSKLAIADANSIELDRNDVTLICGEGYLDCLDDYDIVFKSPGVVLPRDISEYNCKITAQADVFLTVYSAQTVGITGTKGKSTTSSLLHHALKRCGVHCILAGNIGIPVFDIIDEITPDTVMVMEMSCHQLEYISVSPGIAVLLNLYEDHLDHYGTVEKYQSAKKNIYRYQKPGDTLFCNPDFLPSEGECKAKIFTVTPELLPDEAAKNTKLRGRHNRFNNAMVYAICKHYGLDDKMIFSALADFCPLPHRLEYVGSVDGVEYFDDSISTTVESAISAMTSIENAGSILIGGMDRGIDYNGLVDFLLTCSLDHVIFMYDSGKRVLDIINERAGDKKTDAVFVYMPDLKSAVEYAKANTPKGKACILSPAAASYGVFKNFEERGDVFRTLAIEGL